MNFSEKEMDKSKEENVIATIGRAALVNGAKEFVGGVTGLDAMVAIQNTIEKVNESDEGRDLLDAIKEIGEKVGATRTKSLENSYGDIVDSADSVEKLDKTPGEEMGGRETLSLDLDEFDDLDESQELIEYDTY